MWLNDIFNEIMYKIRVFKFIVLYSKFDISTFVYNLIPKNISFLYLFHIRDNVVAFISITYLLHSLI